MDERVRDKRDCLNLRVEASLLELSFYRKCCSELSLLVKCRPGADIFM